MHRIDMMTQLFDIEWIEIGFARLVWASEVSVGDGLAASIEKWEQVVAFYEEFPDSLLQDGGRFTCGLCIIYHSSHCGCCPIAMATEHDFCYDTPYGQYSDALDDEDPYEAYRAAIAEMEFLRSLLPQ